MIILGLTGSIGMGKTTTANMFRDMGIPVFDADAEVHKLQAVKGDAVPLIKDQFPKAIVEEAVDRILLAKEVVKNREVLKTLEGILHPLVHKARNNFIKKAKKSGESLVVLDIPLLFEKGGFKECDYVVVVSAPEETQQQRVLERLNMTPEMFRVILSKQTPDKEKREKADFIVETGNGIEDAKTQVKNIINHLKENK